MASMPRSLIEREIRQSKPFASSAVIPLISVLRTANLIERQYNVLLERWGLTLQQFNVLSILRGAEPDGHPMQEIGARLISETPGVTRLVDRLVIRGLISRASGTQDRRQVICRITQAGLDLLKELDAPLVAADNAVMDPLDEADRQRLVDLLDRIRAPLLSHSPGTEEIAR